MSENNRITIVAPIDWKSSFSYHPLIVVNSLPPSEYRIICKELSDDGGCLTILPSLCGTIDDMLKVLEGCLASGSNFRKVLEEHYGDAIHQLKEIKCDFNGIAVSISDGMTAEEAKLKWLRDGLNSGHKNLVIHMTAEETAALESEPAMREIISRYRKEV